MKKKLVLTINLFILICFSLVKSNAQSRDYLWGKAFKGTGIDEIYSVATDASGNVYTTGGFYSPVDFDPGTGNFTITPYTGWDDAFITKLDSSGNFVWAKRLGGNNCTVGYSVVTDAIGDVYLAGTFRGTTDFNPDTQLTYNLTASGLLQFDMFICKLTGDGNFVWAKNLGGTGEDRINAIAWDGHDDIYVTGYFNTTVDFNPGTGIDTLTATGSRDIFVSKFDTSGNFNWVKSFGGTGYDFGYALTTDASGNVFTTGYFSGIADFDPGTGITNLTSSGSKDIFISKLDSAGNFNWARALGGTGDDVGESIALDGVSNSYIAGYFQNTVDFDPGAGIDTSTSAGGRDIYILKLDSSGNYVWAKRTGAGGYDDANGIALDHAGNVFVAGSFSRTIDFDPGAGTFSLTSTTNGYDDVFISIYDTSGVFHFAKGAGGIYSDYPAGIAIDPSGNAVISGWHYSPSLAFGTSLLINPQGPGGNNDLFVAKFGVVTGNCSAAFTMAPDIAQLHHYWITSNSLGVSPVSYLWSWGDDSYDTIPYPSHTYAAAGFYNICLAISDSTGCVNTYCLNYGVSRMNTDNSIISVDVVPALTGIAPDKSESTLSIFPNPASNRFTVNLGDIENAEVTITDVRGSVVTNDALAHDRQLEVDTKNFNDGVYTLYIRTTGFAVAKKLIIVK